MYIGVIGVFVHAYVVSIYIGLLYTLYTYTYYINAIFFPKYSSIKSRMQ